MSRERAIVDLAGRQQGLLTHGQLRSMGVGRRTIDRWLASGRLGAVHLDVYRLGPRPLTKHGKWLAAVLAMGRDSVLSHESAAALWGMARNRLTVDVTAPRGRQGRPGRAAIRLHRCQLERDECIVHVGIPVTTVARTLFDLAERSEPERLKGAWDEADRLHLLRLREVATIYERRPGRRRARKRIRPLLLAEQRYVGDTDSPLEDRFAAFVAAQGLPQAQTNVLVDGDAVDALWPTARLIVELDSWEFHSHRSAFEKDRSRDADHLLQGYRTIRVTHRRLDEEPDRLAAQIRALLAHSAPPF
jgi:very-short-patch-repair endonuclease/predicted transcriptional regulator of viral defense system